MDVKLENHRVVISLSIYNANLLATLLEYLSDNSKILISAGMPEFNFPANRILVDLNSKIKTLLNGRINHDSK